MLLLAPAWMQTVQRNRKCGQPFRVLGDAHVFRRPLPDHLCLGVLAFRAQPSPHQEPAARTVSACPPGLPSRRPLASNDGTEGRARRARAAPIGATPAGRGKDRVTFSPRLPDINAIAPLYYHGSLSHSIRLNKWRRPQLPSPAALFRLPPSLRSSSFPAPEPITWCPRGPSLHNCVSSEPSYSSRIA